MSRVYLYLAYIFAGEEVMNMLAMLYASEIIAGRKTFDSVPKLLQAQVRKLLEDNEVFDAQ